MSLYIGSKQYGKVVVQSEITQGTDTSDATLRSNDQLPSGVTAYADGVKYIGTRPVDPTVLVRNGTVTIPSGLYTELQSVTVPTESSGGEAELGTKSITENGTYPAAADDLDGYSSVTVNVSATLQSKTATPSSTSQTVTADNGYDGLSSVTVNPIPSNYIVPSGTINITSNGTVDVASYASASVNVPTGGSAPTLQSKTATPTESAQTITADSGFDGLSSVEVGAISSTYVGTGIARKSSTDLSASGATVTAPAGYYAEAATKTVASGTAGTPTATKGTVSNHAVTVTPSVTNTTGYITGDTKTGTGVSVSASELVSGTLSVTSNGTEDVTNYATVSVNVQPTLQSKTATPTESQQTITPDSGNDGLSSVTVNAISNTYVGSGIDQNDSADLTVSGATVTAPAGYYGEAASKSVASGSATTPATTITANPSISVNASGLITATASASQNVTPSVSAGYVSAGTAGTITVTGSNTQQLTTKAAATINTSTSDQTIASGQYLTGTQTIKAVTVSGLSASNILSGVTVKVGDANDDDRIASVTGTVVIQHYYTGSSAPSSSLGENGDIYLQVVS